MKRKGRKKGKEDSFADAALTAGEVYNGTVTPATISRCFERDTLTDSSAWNPAGPALKELVCTGLGVLFAVIMILLLKSGDVEPNPGPLEGGGWLCTVHMGLETAVRMHLKLAATTLVPPPLWAVVYGRLWLLRGVL